MGIESCKENQLEDNWLSISKRYDSDEDCINFLREQSEKDLNFNGWLTVFSGALMLRECVLGESRKEMEKLQLEAVRGMKKKSSTFEQKYEFYSIAIFLKEFQSELRENLEAMSGLVTTPEQQQMIDRRMVTLNKIESNLKQ